jgi:hypothetical protein
LANRDLSAVTAIGVDELLWRKGHQYVTVVYQIDAHAKRLLWGGPGSHAGDTLPVLPGFRRRKNQATEIHL